MTAIIVTPTGDLACEPLSDSATFNPAADPMVVDGANRFNFADAAGLALIPGVSLPASDALPSELHWTGSALVLLPAYAARTVPPVPAQVMMAQARIALLRAGRLTDVSNLIAALPGAPTGNGDEVRIWWDRATIVERANPLVAALSAQLTPPLSSADIDGLFRVAATIA